MHYPRDQYQRGRFIQNRMSQTWPIDAPMSSTTINPQLPTINPSISTIQNSRNICSNSGEALRQNVNVPISFHENDTIEDESLFTHASREEASGGPQAALQFSSTTAAISPQDQWWAMRYEDNGQGQHGDTTEIEAIDQFMEFSTNHVPTDPLDGPQIPGTVAQMESDVGISSAECGAQLRPNAPPRLTYSHEQFASMGFHKKFEIWEEDLCRRSVQTLDTRSSLHFPPGQGSQNSSRKPISGQTSFNHSENQFAPSIHDSGYGDSRPATVSDDNEQGLHFYPKPFTEFEGQHRTPCCHLHEPLSCEHDGQLPRGRFTRMPNCGRCLCSGPHNLSWSAR
jgi:hypothetical protein